MNIEDAKSTVAHLLAEVPLRDVRIELTTPKQPGTSEIHLQVYGTTRHGIRWGVAVSGASPAAAVEALKVHMQLAPPPA